MRALAAARPSRHSFKGGFGDWRSHTKRHTTAAARRAARKAQRRARKANR